MLFTNILYEHVVTILTYGKETIKIGDITTALLAREQRRKKVQCFKCGDWGHVKKECPEKRRQVLMLQYQWVTLTVTVIFSSRFRDGHLQLYKLQGRTGICGVTGMKLQG